MNMNDLRLLFQKKNKKNLTGIELEKYDVIEKLLEMDDLFFNIDFKTAYGVLDYLGIESDKIFEVYMQLISFDNFKDTQEKQYTLYEKNN